MATALSERSTSMTPLVIVPARAGSKGVPLKNWRDLPDGSTLVGRAIAIGLQIGQVVVSSDGYALAAMPEVTWLNRPASLAQDDTPMREVVEHVLAQIPGEPDQPIVLLQPTTPLRTLLDVSRCLDFYCEVETPVATVRPIPREFWRAVRIDTSYSTRGSVELPPRRQVATPLYLFSGDAYIFPRSWGLTDSFHPFPIDTRPYVNVDDESDWQTLCAIIQAQNRQTANGVPSPTTLP